ncbi:MAG TPA: hypothetical protein PK668_15810 [Myxococcota bacterium]|nr:hypothetical protein [Myxococcota bacterium]HRY94362.1 hypothetical protein [Myxococcota bacterium]HSA24871.1 hypothetical protein [Myxococcota bacterium]
MRRCTLIPVVGLGALLALAVAGCSSEGDPCAPDCAGRECGLDPLCGESCGDCLTGERCDPQGVCQPGCTPDCAGKACGSDGCQGSCGTCQAGESCDASGQCQACAPDCAGRQCGDDGCQGSCGTCQAGESCDANGLCAAAPVVLGSGHSGWKDTSCSGCHTLADLPAPPHDASWNGADCAACHGANGACDARGHQTGNDCTNCHNSRHGYSARADCVACHQNTLGGLANCP